MPVSIPEATIAKWQRVVDLTARLADVPACLVMKTDAPDHAVLVSSATADNPYTVGQTFTLKRNLYCHAVLERRDELVVRDARADPDWRDNEDLKVGMSFYIGYPIHWPDGSLFGTICVLDRRDNERAMLHRDVLLEFGRLIEGDLALEAEIERRKLAEAELGKTLAELEQRVARRTQKLAEAMGELEETNTALRVLVSKLESSQLEVEGCVRRQIAELVLPHLAKLRGAVGDREPDGVYAALVEESLSQITSSFAETLVGAFECLTPAETEVAQMVMAGRTTKDIARALSREPSTIDFHRNNIRRKLGLDDRRVTLRSHLRALAG